MSQWRQLTTQPDTVKITMRLAGNIPIFWSWQSSFTDLRMQGTHSDPTSL